MTKIPSILTAGILALTAAGTALAHHAGKMYDRSTEATVTGEVEEWRWANPHAFLQIHVTDENNGKELWSFESTSPNILVQQGWKRTSLEPGDEVEVIYNPLKDGSPGGSLVGVVLPDGKRLNARSGSGGGDSASENLKEE
jgi:hypothetical protein